MFLFVLLLVVEANTLCREYHFIHLLDCADLSVNSTRSLSHGVKPWVHVLNLRRNDLIRVNEAELLASFPDLRVVDLHENPNLDCQAVKTFKFLVRSDCRLTVNSMRQFTTTLTPSTI